MADPRSKRQHSTRSRAGSSKAGGHKPQARGRSGKAQRSSRSSSGAQANRTRDHDEIQRWAEARGGRPSIVKRTAKGKGNASGVLRIDFPGFSGQGSLQEVSWDEWFEVFDDRNLEFLYQKKAKNGKPSRFNKLVCPG